jgi:hypothetical protein
MERVHLEHAAANIGREEQPGKTRPGNEAQGVGHRRAAPPARPLVAGDVLEQAAAREDVDRLEAATDAEDRKAAGLCHPPRLGL